MVRTSRAGWCGSKTGSSPYKPAAAAQQEQRFLVKNQACKAAAVIAKFAAIQHLQQSMKKAEQLQYPSDRAA